MTLLERKRVEEKRSDKEKSATSQLMRSYRPSGVFLTAHILWWVGNDGKDCWECRWRSKIFAPKHALRAPRHVLEIWKNDIAICKAAISEIYHKRYSDLYSIKSTPLEGVEAHHGEDGCVIICCVHISILIPTGVSLFLSEPH